MTRRKDKTYYVLLPDGKYEYWDAADEIEAVEAVVDPGEYDAHDQFVVFCSDDAKTFVPHCVATFKEEK